MKKRLLAMIMAFVMAMSLLPMSALAVDGTNQIVSNGKEETAPDSQERVKHSKIIRQTGENTFDITLEVKTKEEIKEYDISPDAAVVLVLDVSNSMSSGDIADAKNAAKNFVTKFAEDAGTAKRQVAIVEFGSNAKTVLGWTEANTDTGFKTITDDGIAKIQNKFSYTIPACTESGEHVHYERVNVNDLDRIEYRDNWGRRDDGWYCTVCGERVSTADKDHMPTDASHMCLVSVNDPDRIVYKDYPGSWYDGWYCEVCEKKLSTENNSNKPSDTTHYCLKKVVYPGPHGEEPRTDGGGTNIEGGLRLANNLLAAGKAENGAIEGINNLFVVMMTDGVPTYYVKDSDETASTTFMNGTEGGGNEATHNDYHDVYCTQDGHTSGDNVPKQIKDQGAKLYTVSYKSDDVKGTVNKQEIDLWLASFATQTFKAGDNINTGLDNIATIIVNQAKAWILTDPMAQYINFGENSHIARVDNETESDAVRKYNTDTNTLIWDLKNDATRTGPVDGWYTYTLTYSITLDTLANGYSAGNTYDTNGTTKLTYMLSDENGDLQSKLYETFLTVPKVKGFDGSLTFKKVAAGTTTGLSGAKFELTCGDWKYTTEDGEIVVSSGEDGAVTFENVPSGHTYTLTETDAPDNYNLNTAPYTVVVEYGKATITDASGNPVTQIENTRMTPPAPETGSLTISKAFESNDANDIKAQFDGSNKKITFKIQQDGGEAKEVTLPVVSGEGADTTYTWSKTIDGLVPGNYTVTESGAGVTGYDLATTYEVNGEESSSVTVTAGATATMNVINTYTKHVPNVTVAKELVSIGGVDASNDNKVAGEGQEIVWKITVTNNGKADAENLTLTDLLNGVENEKVTITPNKETTYNEGGKTFNVSANGGKAEFTAKYKVTDADAGKTLINGVKVNNDDNIKDDAAPVYTFVKDIVTSADVNNLPKDVTNALATKELTPTYPAKDNDPVYLNKAESVTLLYAITVTGAEGTEYTIADDGAIVVGENVANGKIPESGTVTVYVAKIFNANSIDKDTGKATNTATLTVGGKTDTATEETDVINIDVEKKVSQVGETEVKDGNIPMAQKDDVITWTITVTNNSKVAASGLKLTDNLNGVADKVAVKDATDQDALAEDYSFNLDAGETATFTATYTVTKDDAGTEIVNVAVIKNGETIVEEGESEDVVVDSMSISKTVVDKEGDVPKDIKDKLAGAGKTITYPTSQLSIKASDEVTLLYKIEVTGIEGRTYTISDENATFLTDDGGSFYTVNILEDTTDDDDIIGSAAVYVIRTFKGSDIQDGNLTNVATMTDRDGNKSVQDDEKTPAKEVSTPVSPGGGGNHKPPVLNKEDHYGYIIGYPVDYETGEKTTDQTLMPVKPEGNITRAEVATIFFRMLTDESRTEFWSQTNDYSDVNEGQWFNAAISTLSNAGILNGYNDGTFRPNGKITRAEFATMASRFFEYADTAGDNPFSDVSEDSWYYKFVMAASEMGLINGYPDGTFGPGKLITRAEAVTIVNRTLDRHPDQDHFLKDMLVWVDNMDTSKWYYEAMQEATNSHEYEMKGSGDNKYENWTKMLEIRDWAAFEKEWSDANSATGGEVVK